MKYYIQRHQSGYVGNCLLWWRKGACGYTCDIEDAEVFDGDDPKFKEVAKDKSKYTAWEKDYIDSCASKHVDHQKLNFDLSGIIKSERKITMDSLKIKLRNKIGSLPVLKDNPSGDNIAVALALYFDSHDSKPSDDPIDTEIGWGEWVVQKTNEALDSIVEELNLEKLQENKQDKFWDDLIFKEEKDCI